MVDEFTGKNNKALSSKLPALMQQKCQFCRETGRRCIGCFTGCIKNNSSFCRIGDKKAQIFVFHTGQHLFPIAFRIQAAGYTGNNSGQFLRFPVLSAAKDQGIKPVLFSEAVCCLRVSASRLHQYNFCIKTGIFVHPINKIFHESPQKITFSELKHAFRSFLQKISFKTSCFQRCKPKSFHIPAPYFLFSYGCLPM